MMARRSRRVQQTLGSVAWTTFATDDVFISNLVFG